MTREELDDKMKDLPNPPMRVHLIQQVYDIMNEENEKLQKINNETLTELNHINADLIIENELLKKQTEWNSTAESKYPNDFERVLGCYVWKYLNGKIEYVYYTVYCWEDKYYDVDGSRRFWKDIDGDEADEPDYWKRENPPKIEEN